MTSTKGKTEVVKQDARGRVRVSVERREALLDEFEKSGSSGARFARLAGIKYATFANWVQNRRRQRLAVSTVVKVPASGNDAVAKAGPVHLFEALVEGNSGVGQSGAATDGLLIELPGGCRLRIASPLELQMAAELVSLIAQRGRC